ncbi:MAG: hypothetical protein WBQ46_08580 [Terriglobales bacterium]
MNELLKLISDFGCMCAEDEVRKEIGRLAEKITDTKEITQAIEALTVWLRNDLQGACRYAFDEPGQGIRDTQHIATNALAALETLEERIEKIDEEAAEAAEAAAIAARTPEQWAAEVVRLEQMMATPGFIADYGTPDEPSPPYS